MPTFDLAKQFQPYIGYQPSPQDPNQLEFYRKDQQTGEIAQPFNKPEQLFNFASTLGFGTVAGFDQLQTPRSMALDQVKQEINQVQNSLFSQNQDNNKRRSSQLTDQIATQNQTLNQELETFNQLRQRLTELQAPNFEQQFRNLRTEAGVPQLEERFLDTRQTRRELPFTERAQTGNAGVATESQLRAQTAQKDIPLQIEEANVIDRLKLASDFVNQALRLKELDSNTARQAIGDAINLTAQAINLGRTQLSDLRSEQKEQTNQIQNAAQFAFENQITQPFFEMGNVIFDTATGQPQFRNVNGEIQRISDGKQYSTPEEFFADTGVQSFNQIQQVKGTTNLKASDISTFTDASGFVTAVDKRTGQPLWRARIGRAGSATPNINVSPIADPTTGFAKYTQIIDKNTGEIKYIDNSTGEEVPADQVQIGEGVDPLDQFIDGVIGEVINELNP